jgi:hypothetical protein
VRRHLDIEGQRDRLERWLMFDVGHRERQAPLIWLPYQVEKLTALALGGYKFLDDLPVHVRVELDRQTLRCSLDQ